MCRCGASDRVKTMCFCCDVATALARITSFSPGHSTVRLFSAVVIVPPLFPLLTRFDLLDHRVAVVVPHLPDVQQGVEVSMVGGPVVHIHPGAAAAAVHHDPIV